MRKTYVAAAIYLLFSTAAAGQTWFSGSLNNALAKAKSEKKLVLLDFFQKGG